MSSRSLDRQRVKEGLQRRARLAPREHAVDFGRAATARRSSRPRPALRRSRCRARSARRLRRCGRQLGRWRCRVSTAKRCSARIERAGVRSRRRRVSSVRARCGATARRRYGRAARAAPSRRDASHAGASQRLQQHASASRDTRRDAFGRAHEGRERASFERSSPPGACRAARAQRVHAFDLASKRHEVEPRFEYLVLASSALERARATRLAHSGATLRPPSGRPPVDGAGRRAAS